MGKIPRQRTGSGGWPDRRRVGWSGAGASKSSGKGCAVLAFALLGSLLAALGTAGAGAWWLAS